VTDLPPPPPPPPSWNPPPPSGAAPDAGSALSYGWQKFQQNVGPLIIAVLIPFGVQIVVGFIGSIALRGSVVLYALIEVIGFVAVSAAGIGVYRVALQITAGEPADIAKAYQYDRWGEWILFSIVFGLFVGVSLALCIVPGLFVLAFFGLAPFFFIDKRMSLGQALTASRQAVSMRGLAFPVLLSIVVGVLGVIACVVGLLVTYPIAYTAVAFLYRYATGQAVAE
jgi:uncharacterized membrane protein